MATALLTIGHGNATSDELAALLRAAGVERVVDVRKVPRSRRHPAFWREAMEHWIPELAASAYVWEPALGGFRKPDPKSPNIALRHPSFRAYADYMASPEFARALDALLVEGAHVRSAILCSESLWWRCHRRLISDAAELLHGAPVVHLMHSGKAQPHLLTEGVRKTEAGTLRYDVGVTQALPGIPLDSRDIGS